MKKLRGKRTENTTSFQFDGLTEENVKTSKNELRKTWLKNFLNNFIDKIWWNYKI